MASDIDLITSVDHADPFSFLGIHNVDTHLGKHIVLRAFIPGAEQVWVIEASDANQYEMQRVGNDGFFELQFPGRQERFPYRLRAINRFGDTWEFHDPY